MHYSYIVYSCLWLLLIKTVSCRIRSVVSNAGSNHKQIYSNGACLSAKIAAPFSVSREEERGYKTVFQSRLVPPTVLMLLLHDLSSKSSHPICKVATWVESCSAAIRGAAAQRELVSSGAFGSVLTVEVKWEDAVLDCTSFGRSKTALEISEQFFYSDPRSLVIKAVMLTAEMGEMEEDGVYHRRSLWAEREPSWLFCHFVLVN